MGESFRIPSKLHLCKEGGFHHRETQAGFPRTCITDPGTIFPARKRTEDTFTVPKSTYIFISITTIAMAIHILSLLVLYPLSTLAQTTSPKRGLCHVPSNKYPSDDSIWFTNVPSPPTWYYNYGPSPSTVYTSRQNLQFVPMLWGASASDTGTPFFDTVKAQIDAGANITHVLSYNEPDATNAVGGSNLDVSTAATRWKAELFPLQKLGVKVGAPAVTGGASGWTWLDNWFKACGNDCNPDFMTVHWYGNFEGMMSHVGQVAGKWPMKPIWVTEYGYPNQGLVDTEKFTNMSLASFDGWK